MKNPWSTAVFFLATSSLFFLFLSPLAAAEKYQGWGLDSDYNKLYNYKERDSLKGIIKKFKKITPMPKMAAGTAFILDLGDEEILVHLCPWDFADPKETGIKKGVKTKVKGSWALIDDQDVFLAAKIKQGDNFAFKTRLSKDGTPFWEMSPEQLAKEQQELAKELKGQ